MSECAPGLDDDQLAWLQEQLQGRAEQHGGMPLDVAHGFITAAVSGPRLVLPMEWLPAVLGQPLVGAEGDPPAGLELGVPGRLRRVVEAGVGGVGVEHLDRVRE